MHGVLYDVFCMSCLMLRAACCMSCGACDRSMMRVTGRYCPRRAPRARLGGAASPLATGPCAAMDLRSTRLLPLAPVRLRAPPAPPASPRPSRHAEPPFRRDRRRADLGQAPERRGRGGGGRKPQDAGRAGSRSRGHIGPGPRRARPPGARLEARPLVRRSSRGAVAVRRRDGRTAALGCAAASRRTACAPSWLGRHHVRLLSRS